MAHHVALFITCLTDQFYPHVGVAVTKVLEKLGCRVSFPAEQTCCGQPFYNNGFSDETRELARKFVEVFEGYDYIVSPSASCCTTVREHYRHLLEGDHAYEHGLRHVISRTYEFVEFLDKVLKVDLTKYRLPERRPVTYHYTCHSRGIGLTGEPLKLLRQIGGVDYRPMEKTDQCCGFGGTFAVKYPAISGAIAEDKAACIAAAGADTVVCNEAGCAMNIAGMLHRKGQGTQVKHIAELIAEAMGIGIDTW